MSEHGKTYGEALGSIQKGNETCEWATSIPQVIQGRTQEVSGGVTCSESRESLGVVACIVPFNFPIMVPFWTLPIAIAAGNCVILKPSEKVPRTMQKVTTNRTAFEAAAAAARPLRLFPGVDVCSAFIASLFFVCVSRHLF